MSLLFFIFFFFQAEDGIRDTSVTGVQTCALPIFTRLDGNSTPLTQPLRPGESYMTDFVFDVPRNAQGLRLLLAEDDQIGRASCRERVEIWVVVIVVKKKKEDSEIASEG